MGHSALEHFVDELIKLSAVSPANKLFRDSPRGKIIASKKNKGAIGQQWRQGSPLSAVKSPHEISEPYGRSGSAKQVGSFSAQSSEADAESGNYS